MIDPNLLKTCHKLLDTSISTILLSKNSLVTWFIIVPNTDKIEWYELDIDLQMQLNKQVNTLSQLLKQDFNVDKINIATIGNVVPQMHIHVIGRKKDDHFWPNVVWGRKDSKEYTTKDLVHITDLIKNLF